MGLDNIPHAYPCIKAGTAILVEDNQLDCEATRAANQCPWQREARHHGLPVYGMLGLPCWYRGKAGNWYLQQLQNEGYDIGDSAWFYGPKAQEEPGPQLDPDYCINLAKWMEDHVEPFAALVVRKVGANALELNASAEDIQKAIKTEIDNYRYAAWWLRFVAEYADGSDTWY